MFKAEVVAHSVNSQGIELVSFVATFNRWILAELNTHRMFSRNSASSRAIPFKKMVESVKTNPFIPMAWQKDHPGMQGKEYITDPNIIQMEIADWLDDRDYAVAKSVARSERDVTKQICNRTLEPFMWHTAIVSATDWENFFHQRCPKYAIPLDPETSLYFRSKKDALKHPASQDWKDNTDFEWLQMNQGTAEIHMMALAEAMWDAYSESTPKVLADGEWHICYEDKIIDQFGNNLGNDVDGIPVAVKIGTVMAARASYTVVGIDLQEWNVEKYLNKCNELISADPVHGSPMEHCAVTMTSNDYVGPVRAPNGKFAGGLHGVCGNYRGFIQYRKMIPNENRAHAKRNQIVDL